MRLKVRSSKVVLGIGSKIFENVFLNKSDFEGTKARIVEPNRERRFYKGEPCWSRFQESKIFIEQEASNRRVWQERELEWIANEEGAMDVWLGYLSNVLIVDDSSKFVTDKCETGGRFRLTGAECKAQTRHNGLSYRPGKSPGYFVLENWAEKGELYVCSVCHYYVHYEEQKKRNLARTSQMESFFLLPFSMFVRNGYAQHARANYLVHPNLCYQVYFVPKDIKLPDEI